MAMDTSTLLDFLSAWLKQTWVRWRWGERESERERKRYEIHLRLRLFHCQVMDWKVVKDAFRRQIR